MCLRHHRMHYLRLALLAAAKIADDKKSGELWAGGVKNLIVVPCLGAGLGLLVRVKLDARSTELKELDRLRVCVRPVV